MINLDNLLRLGLLLAIIQFGSSLFGQGKTNNCTITGKITDNDGYPITNVHIIDDSGKTGSISNNVGFFSIKLHEIASSLVFTHIAYETKIINIDKDFFSSGNNEINLKLNKKHIPLDEIEILDTKIELAYNNKDVWVLDYEITNSGILLLTKENRKRNIVLIDFNQDTIATNLLTKKITKLFKDGFGNIQLISKDSVYQLFFNGINLDLLFPHPISKFQKKLMPIALTTKNILIQQIYSNFNQTISYYIINKSTKERKVLAIISNEEQANSNNEYFNERKQQQINYRHKMGDFDSTSILNDIRKQFNNDIFFSTILCKPIYAPIKLINNNIFLFAFEDNEIIRFDLEGNRIADIPISFHKSKQWDNQVIIDIALEKCYAKFIEDGIVTIKEIDPITSEIKGILKLRSHIFPQKIEIHNNQVYYLHHNMNTSFLSEKRFLYRYRYAF